MTEKLLIRFYPGNRLSCTRKNQINKPPDKSFASLGAWTNVNGDMLDWTRHSGATSSSGTGPYGAIDGSYYAYTESSYPNYPTKTALLEGPAFDFTNKGQAEMTFSYHMYGASMGTLYVEVSDNCQNWTTVWSLSGNQGNAWYQANVDLGAYSGQIITVRFRGVTGNSYTSDISVNAF